MNYLSQYDELIATRIILCREKGDGVYYEWHHIKPICIGGEKKGKMVLLTAREHYLAHWLLHKAYPQKHLLALAFWKMTIGTRLQGREKMTSRMYASAKRALSVAQRALNLGKRVKPEHLLKWSKHQNRARKIINTVTGEIAGCAKDVWKRDFKDRVTYSTFNYYLKKRLRNKMSSVQKAKKLTKSINWRYYDDKAA
jgi:hypothetical protein